MKEEKTNSEVDLINDLKTNFSKDVNTEKSGLNQNEVIKEIERVSF